MKAENLNLLQSRLLKLAVPVIKCLNLGIDKNELRDFILNHFKINFDNAFLSTLYGWHNGTRLGDNSATVYYLFPGYLFQAIEDIHLVLISEDHVFRFIDSKMFPIFTSGQGDYLTIDLKEVLQFSSAAPIYYISVYNTDFIGYTLIYESFDSMIETILECYEKRYYFIAEDGMLDLDWDKTIELSLSLNPSSPYWQRMAIE